MKSSSLSRSILRPVGLSAICASLLSPPLWAGVNPYFSLVSLGDAENTTGVLYGGDHAAVTPDGRYVVFRSSASNFVNGGYQIFLRDRVAGTTELISRNDAGAYGNGSSDWPSISNDGCKVVFESDSSNLVANDVNGTTDVFVRNRCVPASTGLVSVNAGGIHANGQSKSADISGNGGYVVFWSYATNLVNGVGVQGQVYRRNLNSGAVNLVSASVTQAGKGGNYGSDCPAISDDGSKVAFWSYAYDLVAEDSAGMWDIFVWDSVGSPAIKRASLSSAGVPQNQGDESISAIHCPAISGDGRFVAFDSKATNLVVADTNNVSDIFVKDMNSGNLQRASVDSTGSQQGNAASYGRPALSLDGAWVAFTSTATNIATETGSATGTPRTILHNWNSGQTTAPTSSSNAGDFPAISGDADARYLVAFANSYLDPNYASAGVFVYDRGSSGNVNQKPIANAGSNQTVGVGSQVTLNGSASSDPEGAALTYSWSQTDGPATVSFTNSATASPRFIASEVGLYKFSLTVSDGVNTSDPVTVNVDVVSAGENHPPVANAGLDQSAVVGDEVALDASASRDDDNDNLSYSWEQLFGPEAVSFDSPISETPRFTPGLAGTYIFQLVVNDGSTNSDPSFVSVEVVDPAQAILLDASQSRIANIGDKLTLSGSAVVGPEANRKKVKYYWSQLLGPAVKLTGSASKLKRTFTPSEAGTYVFSVVASDGVYASNEALVVVDVDPSISIAQPQAGGSWVIGQNAEVHWSVSGIAANKKLTLVFSPDGGANFYILKKGLSAGKGLYRFKVKPDRASGDAYAAVCLLESAKNPRVCGVSESFSVVYP